MSIYLKKFNVHSEYENYINGSDVILPNVSLCDDEMHVHYTNYYNSIKNAVITCDSTIYNGLTQVATNIVVTLDGNTLVSGTDYIISNNNGGINAGDYIFTIDGIGLYGDSKNGTFTINKAEGSVTIAPTAKTLIPSGSAQALVNAGSGTGTMMYNLDGGDWSSSIPTATSIGTYTVGYKAAESENYTESTTNSVIAEINDCPYVEIGGKKWAIMNVGASSVTDTGLYFQWGDIQGYAADQVGSNEGLKYFDWADYKYGNGTSSQTSADMTKYNSTDGKTTLEASDDAVTAAWGNRWRMPTSNDFQTLGAAVNTVWTDNYQDSGVAGLICTAKTDSSKVLFFPASGQCYRGNVSNVDSCRYWSRSIYTGTLSYAHYFCFDDSVKDWKYYTTRLCGFSVRGIINE